MTNAELIKALKDAEMYMIYVAPSCYASCEAIKAIRAAADAFERMTKEQKEIKDKLIERICENCDTPPETRLRLCGECPIISPIREAFE